MPLSTPTAGPAAQVTRGRVDSSLRTQALRFIISGALSAIPDLGLTALFQHVVGLDAALARTIGFIVGTLTAYMINRRWTFQAPASTKRFLAVCVLYAITYVINAGLYKYGFLVLADRGMSSAWATVCAFVVAQGTATVVNFIIQRVWIFRVR